MNSEPEPSTVSSGRLMVSNNNDDDDDDDYGGVSSVAVGIDRESTTQKKLLSCGLFIPKRSIGKRSPTNIPPIEGTSKSRYRTRINPLKRKRPNERDRKSDCGDEYDHWAGVNDEDSLKRTKITDDLLMMVNNKPLLRMLYARKSEAVIMNLVGMNMGDDFDWDDYYAIKLSGSDKNWSPSTTDSETMFESSCSSSSSSSPSPPATQSTSHAPTSIPQTQSGKMTKTPIDFAILKIIFNLSDSASTTTTNGYCDLSIPVWYTVFGGVTGRRSGIYRIATISQEGIIDDDDGDVDDHAPLPFSKSRFQVDDLSYLEFDEECLSVEIMNRCAFFLMNPFHLRLDGKGNLEPYDHFMAELERRKRKKALAVREAYSPIVVAPQNEANNDDSYGVGVYKVDDGKLLDGILTLVSDNKREELSGFDDSLLSVKVPESSHMSEEASAAVLTPTPRTFEMSIRTFSLFLRHYCAHRDQFSPTASSLSSPPSGSTGIGDGRHTHRHRLRQGQNLIYPAQRSDRNAVISEHLKWMTESEADYSIWANRLRLTFDMHRKCKVGLGSLLKFMSERAGPEKDQDQVLLLKAALKRFAEPREGTRIGEYLRESESVIRPVTSDRIRILECVLRSEILSIFEALRSELKDLYKNMLDQEAHNVTGNDNNNDRVVPTTFFETRGLIGGTTRDLRRQYRLATQSECAELVDFLVSDVMSNIEPFVMTVAFEALNTLRWSLSEYLTPEEQDILETLIRAGNSRDDDGGGGGSKSPLEILKKLHRAARNYSQPISVVGYEKGELDALKNTGLDPVRNLSSSDLNARIFP